MRRLTERLLNVLRPARADEDAAREIASHLALLEDDYLRRGLPADEARRAARLALGGVAQTNERHRDAREGLLSRHQVAVLDGEELRDAESERRRDEREPEVEKAHCALVPRDQHGRIVTRHPADAVREQLVELGERVGPAL